MTRKRKSLRTHSRSLRQRKRAFYFYGDMAYGVVLIGVVLVGAIMLVFGLNSSSLSTEPKPTPTPRPLNRYVTPLVTQPPGGATATPPNAPTNTPGVPPLPGSSAGLLISQQELAQLPTSGAAWSRMQSAANSNWGSACLYDNNCMHDVNTLAGALVAARTGDASLRAKVISGIEAAMQSNFSRTLEASRGLQAYILAADIIGYRTPAFETWLRNTLDTSMGGRAGIATVYESALRDPSNWGNHARASAIAAALYLNDTSRVSALVESYKEFIGLPVSQRKLLFEATNWHADASNKAGVNRKGATISGKNVSGVLPEDWRRGGEFAWLPGNSGYMWEGMQGFVVAAVLLHRANQVPFNASDNAVVRAMDALYGQGEVATNSPAFNNPPVSDDTWIPWMVNKYGGTSYPASATSPGKNMGWTDWIYQ